VADEETLGAGGEEHARLRLVYGAARRLHALDGLRNVVQRTCVFTRSVLDRQTGDSRPHAEGDALRYVLGAVAVSGLEIGVHRERRRLDDVRDVAEHHVSRQGQRRVGQRAREREAGARRGQRWKPELREEDGRAPVPGVGNDEAASLVETSKGGDAIGGGEHARIAAERPPFVNAAAAGMNRRSRVRRRPSTARNPGAAATRGALLGDAEGELTYC
jgi:hypothetical protein